MRTAVPEPPLPEQARTLVAAGRLATLATALAGRDGAPFATLVPYLADEDGRPTLWLSGLALHTRNLAGDPRASLLVAATADADVAPDAPRATVVGRVEAVPAAAVPVLRDAWLARHPAAGAWAGLPDFALYRLAVDRVWWIGGFGAMGWIPADAYTAAEPDPLLAAAPRILAHMNADHAEALARYCRAYAGVAADSATMAAVDRLGFAVVARVGDVARRLRIAFPREVRTADAVRAVLVEMVRAAGG
jgi:heme oxygenase (biliverdin-IX-beta and delta-forming)